MARVTHFHKGLMRVKNVKNLGWFFRKARTTPVRRFELYEANDGYWEMFVDFEDSTTFSTQYASLEVFKRTMKRQRSLKGVTVYIHHANYIEEWGI